MPTLDELIAGKTKTQGTPPGVVTLDDLLKKKRSWGGADKPPEQGPTILHKGPTFEQEATWQAAMNPAPAPVPETPKWNAQIPVQPEPVQPLKRTWGQEINNALARGGLQTLAAVPGTAGALVGTLRQAPPVIPTPDRELRPFWKSVLPQSVQGMVKEAMPSAEAAAVMRGEQKFTPPPAAPPLFPETLNTLQQAAKAIYDESQSEALQPTKKGVMGYIANVTAETLPLMAVSTAATLATGGVGGFLTGAMAEGESAYQAAKAKGATEEQAQAERLIVGTVNGAIERMQADEILKLGKGISGEALQQLAQSVREKAWKRLAKQGAQIEATHIAKAVNEGFEEALQESTQIGAATIHGDKITLGEAVPRIAKAGLGGFTAGYGLTGLSGLSQAITEQPEPSRPANAPYQETPVQPKTLDQIVAEKTQGLPMATPEEVKPPMSEVMRGMPVVAPQKPKGGQYGTQQSIRPVEPGTSQEKAAPVEAVAGLGPKPAGKEVTAPVPPEPTIATSSPTAQGIRETAPAAGLKGKEPWQMTSTDYVFDKVRPDLGVKPAGYESEYYRAEHKATVRNAVEQGKPVPPEVLAEYPELQEVQRGSEETTRTEAAGRPVAAGAPEAAPGSAQVQRAIPETPTTERAPVVVPETVKLDKGDPRKVGGTYYDGYWHEDYTVLDISPNPGTGRPVFTIRWDDGRQVKHQTGWDEKTDKVVRQPAPAPVVETAGEAIPVEHNKPAANYESAPEVITTQATGKQSLQVAPEGKQPWEMTRADFVKDKDRVAKQRDGTYSDAYSPLIGNTGKTPALLHKNLVQLGVEQGKPVPRAVLEEYKSEKWAADALAKMGEGGGRLEGIVVYRGGETPLDASRGGKRGISVTTDKKLAGYFTGEGEGQGAVSEAILPNTAKVLRDADIPPDLNDAYLKAAAYLKKYAATASEKSFEWQQRKVWDAQQKIVDYAREHGYDAVEFLPENEIRVIKPDVLIPTSGPEGQNIVQGGAAVAPTSSPRGPAQPVPAVKSGDAKLDNLLAGGRELVTDAWLDEMAQKHPEADIATAWSNKALGLKSPNYIAWIKPEAKPDDIQYVSLSNGNIVGKSGAERMDAPVPNRPQIPTTVDVKTQEAKPTSETIARQQAAAKEAKTQEGISGPLRELGGMPRKPPGLTKSETEHLGKREQEALKAGQVLGGQIGYKLGHRHGIDQAKTAIFNMRLAQKLEKDQQEKALEIVREFVPRVLQGRYMKRVLNAKTPKRVEHLMTAIRQYVEKADKRLAVAEMRVFIKGLKKKYKGGKGIMPALRSDVRQRILDFLEKYDLNKLTDTRRHRLESRDEYVKRTSYELAGIMEDLDADEGFDPDAANYLGMGNARVEELKRLAKVPVSELGTDEIRSILDGFKELVRVAELKGDIKYRTRVEPVRDQIHYATKEIYPKNKVAGVVTERFHAIRYLLNLGQARIDTLIGYAMGKEVEAGKAGPKKTWKGLAAKKVLFSDMEDAQDNALGKFFEQTDFAKEQMGKIGFGEKEWRGLNDVVGVTLGGKQVDLPIRNLALLYAHTQSQENLEALLRAKGLTINIYERNLKTGLIKTRREIRTGRLSTSEIVDAIKKLPDVYVKFVHNVMFETNKRIGAPAMNETSMRLENRDVATKKNYVHLPREIERSVEGGRLDLSAPPEKRGRAQYRTGGTNRIYLDSIDNEFIQQMQFASEYHGMTQALQAGRTLLANHEFRQRMKETGNGRILQQIDTLFRRAQGVFIEQSVIEKLASKVLGRYGKGVLSLRISGGLVQLTSPAAAWSVVEPKYFIGIGVPTPKDIRKLKAKFPRLRYRWDMGGFHFVFAELSATHTFETELLGKNPVTEKLLHHYTMGDEVSLWRIWRACQRKVAAEQGLKRDTSEGDAAAWELYRKALNGQGQFDMLHRSDLTSNPNVFLKGSTLFTSTTNAFTNTIFQAMSDWHKGRIGAGEAGRAVAGVLTSVVMTTTVRTLFRHGIKAGLIAALFALGFHKEKKELEKKILADQAKKELGNVPKRLLNEVSGLMVFGQVANALISGTINKLRGRSFIQQKDIQTGNVFTDMFLDTKDTFEQVALTVSQYLTQERYGPGKREGQLKWKKTVVGAADSLAELVALMTGLPYSGIKTDVVYPYRGAESAITGTPTDEEIVEKIAKETYLKDYKDAKGISHKPGEIHVGQEKKVKELASEYAERTGRTPSKSEILKKGQEVSVTHKMTHMADKSTDDLLSEIAKLSYRESGVDPTTRKFHQMGAPHAGQEQYVEALKKAWEAKTGKKMVKSHIFAVQNHQRIQERKDRIKKMQEARAK